MSATLFDGQRLLLALQTRAYSEYRSPAGALVMFEVASHRTSFGRLCATLAQMPGVEFADLAPPVKYTGPARFRFKGADYHVSIPHADYRVAPLSPPAPSAATQELLAHVKENLLRRAGPPTQRIF